MKKLSSIKTAYDLGVLQALEACGLLKTAAQKAQVAEALTSPAATETRLRKDHRNSDFFAVKKTFSRASPQKKETGHNVPLAE